MVIRMQRRAGSTPATARANELRPALANNRVQGTKVSLSKTNGEQAKVMDEYLKTILAGEDFSGDKRGRC